MANYENRFPSTQPIEWQKKTLVSSVGTNGVFMTFDNLVIGRTYELECNFRINVNVGGGDTSARYEVVHNSTTILTGNFQDNDTLQVNAPAFNKIMFVATSNIVEISAASISSFSNIGGDSPGNNGSSFAILKSYPDIKQVSTH